MRWVDTQTNHLAVWCLVYRDNATDVVELVVQPRTLGVWVDLLSGKYKKQWYKLKKPVSREKISKNVIRTARTAPILTTAPAGYTCSSPLPALPVANR